MSRIVTELHTHTLHSDGSFTVPELVQTAASDGLQCIALTDHNTASGCGELTKELLDSTIPVIHGFEWTTYFGHMVVLDSNKYVDWRFAVPDNIDEMMKQVKAAGGTIGVAHPFRPGSPFCTGCHWDFKLQDWSLPDYIEVWSGAYPQDDIYNQEAYKFWVSVLDKGVHLAITHGKDWHRKDSKRQLDGFTQLDIGDDAISASSAMTAIRNGRTAVSVGATILMTATYGKNCYNVGDTIKVGGSRDVEISVKAALDTTRNHITELFDIKLERVEIISTGGNAIHTFDTTEGTAIVGIDGDYIFARVMGTIGGKPKVIAITSPIYFER